MTAVTEAEVEASYVKGWNAGSRVASEAAAAEIERLRVLSQNNANSWDAIVRERDALRAALRDLLHAIGHDRKDLIDEAADRARHALGE